MIIYIYMIKEKVSIELIQQLSTNISYIVWEEYINSCKQKDKPKITSNKGKPYTKITYYPDFKRFGHKEMKLSKDT